MVRGRRGEDGSTGHPDHCQATAAAMVAAERADLDVLAWVISGHVAATLNDGRPEPDPGTRAI